MLCGMTKVQVLTFHCTVSLCQYLVFGVARSHSAQGFWPISPIKKKKIKTELYDTICAISSVLNPFNTLSLNHRVLLSCKLFSVFFLYKSQQKPPQRQTYLRRKAGSDSHE